MDNIDEMDYRKAVNWSAQMSGNLFKEESSYFNCLKPLLKAMRWHYNDRNLFESLPYKAKRLDRYGFLRVMDLLNFKHEQFNISLASLDKRLMPCLFICKTGGTHIILDVSKQEMTIFDGVENKLTKIPRVELSKEKWKGTVFVFTARDKPDPMTRSQDKWFSKVLQKFKPLFWQILSISFVLNLLALATPLFIMAVYDRVIGSGSILTLVGFGCGVLIALLGSSALQVIRSRILAFIGARLDVTVGNAIMQRIMYLPANYIEGASIGSQLARVKDFDNLREFFTGPAISMIFEFPFIFIFVLVIWLLGGSLVWIPLIMIVLFIGAGILSRIYVKKKIGSSAKSYSNQQKLLIEVVSNIRNIKYTHSEKIWSKRFKDAAADTAFSDYKSNIIVGVISACSDAAVILAALAVLGFGVFKILDGTLSVGGMIATMILLWRVLGPLKSIYTTIAQLDQIRSSISQLNNLMRIVPEHEVSESGGEILQISGYVDIHNVSFRYTPQSDPSLLGINLKIEPGTIVAFTGSSTGGKSTLLKLMLGLYKPQIGYVQLDGRDVRQINPVELRQNIAYVPTEITFFYGSIEQNLLLAKPDATHEEVETALKMADVYDQIMALPDAMQTMLQKRVRVTLPIDLQQKIVLARAFLKASSLFLIDDIVDNFDNVSQEKIMASIESLRKGRTIIICAKRPVPLSIADRIVVFDKGMIVKDGPRKAILPDLLF